MSPIPGTGEFRPRRAGIAAARRQGAKGGTGHPDLRPGFLYPLLRLPLTFRSAATPCGRAAKVRGTQLKPLYYPRRTAAVWGWLRARFPRMTVRGSGAKGDKQLSGTLRRAGCPHPAAPSERYFPSGSHPAALSERYWHSGGLWPGKSLRKHLFLYKNGGTRGFRCRHDFCFAFTFLLRWRYY